MYKINDLMQWFTFSSSCNSLLMYIFVSKFVDEINTSCTNYFYGAFCPFSLKLDGKRSLYILLNISFFFSLKENID